MFFGPDEGGGIPLPSLPLFLPSTSLPLCFPLKPLPLPLPPTLCRRSTMNCL